MTCSDGSGADCDDALPDAWASCDRCRDEDGDGLFGGCDAYVTRAGPDCFDEPSTPSSADLALSALRLPSTFESVGVHVVLETRLADVVLSARICSRGVGGPWPSTPLVPLRGGNERVGSFLWLAPGTEYEVEVMATSASTGQRTVLHGTADTRHDVPPPSSGDTVYVSPTGSDDAGAGTLDAPFATIARAADALGADSGTIELLPGTYRESVRITQAGAAEAYRYLRARPGAVFDGADPAIQAGVSWNHDGATDTWSYGPVAGAPARLRAMFADEERLYPYDTLAALIAGDVPGVEGGFFYDPASARLHLRLPDGSAPGTHVLHAAVQEHAVAVDRADRWVIEGLTLLHYDHGGILVRGSEDVWVRGNVLRYGASIQVAQPFGEPERIPARVVVEDNAVLDSGIWAWGYAACKARGCETTGIHVSCSPEHVIRRNTIDGPFNGIAPTGGVEPDADVVPRCGADGDTYDNLITHVADDGIELDGPGVNQRVFRNVISERHTNSISLSPLTHGPAYVLRNVGDGFGEAFLKLRDDGDVGWKIVAHNTVRPTEDALGYPLWLPPCFDGLLVAGNVLVGRTATLFHPRSGPCLPSDDAFFRSVRYEGNLHWSLDASSALVVEGMRSFPDLATFREATGHERSGVQALPTFERDGITPAASSPMRDAAPTLPGINDRTADGAPDIGAVEG